VLILNCSQREDLCNNITAEVNILGLRFRKSIKIAPGVKINLGKKSAGISFGAKGVSYSVNSSGRRTSTIGIPGTGISYSTTSQKKHPRPQNKKAQTEHKSANVEKENLKQLELDHAKAVAEEYSAKIDAITTIHRSCAEEIPWENIINIPAPFNVGEQGPRETAARQKSDSYKPGFFAKHIHALDANANGSLEKKIAEAIEEDKKEYDEWETAHIMATRIVGKDPDAMLELIEASRIFDDLTEYGSGFEISLIGQHTAEVEFDVMADAVVPKECATLTASGKLSQKPLSATKRLNIMQDYVCSCALRIARDLFAILPIDAVLIHAMDSFIDTSIGNSIKQDILSVLITRSKSKEINFDQIDPSDAMVNFTHNMKFLKTKGFQPIARIRADNVTGD